MLNTDDPLFNNLIIFTKKVMSALPSPIATAFHCEVFVTPKGDFVLCKIASRAGGARVIDTIKYAYGYHLLEQGVLAQCNIKTKRPPFKRNMSAGWLLLPPRRGRITQVPSRLSSSEIIDFHVTAAVGDLYGQAESSVDQILSAIVSGFSSEEVKNRISSLAYKLSTEFHWEDSEGKRRILNEI